MSKYPKCEKCKKEIKDIAYCTGRFQFCESCINGIEGIKFKTISIIKIEDDNQNIQ